MCSKDSEKFVAKHVPGRAKLSSRGSLRESCLLGGASFSTSTSGSAPRRTTYRGGKKATLQKTSLPVRKRIVFPPRQVVRHRAELLIEVTSPPRHARARSCLLGGGLLSTSTSTSAPRRGTCRGDFTSQTRVRAKLSSGGWPSFHLDKYFGTAPNYLSR